MKISLVVTLLLFFFLHSTSAQNNQEIKELPRNWYWGISIRLSNNLVSTNWKNYRLSLDTLKASHLGFNFGLIFQKVINTKIKFETGLLLNYKGFRFKDFIISEQYYSPHSGYWTEYYLVKDNFDLLYLD